MSILIHQPYYISLSTIIPAINGISFYSAVERTFDDMYKHGERFDVIYGHFWECGLLAAKIGKNYCIPAFVANGESEISISRIKRNVQYSKYISGVISVSGKSKDETIRKGLSTEDKIIVLPNAVDSTLFHPINKDLARDELGFSHELFIISFVGGFIERKGSNRVAQALDQLDDVYSFFIGKGESVPKCKNIL